jgi:cellulose 1,4-beta-cellobiosidase
VPLAATAADSGGAVVRVEFRVDGNLVNTDTAAPYAFTATGPHGRQPQRHCNGGRQRQSALSTTSTAVNFTIASTGNTAPTVSLTAPTQWSVVPGWHHERQPGRHGR